VTSFFIAYNILVVIITENLGNLNYEKNIELIKFLLREMNNFFLQNSKNNESYIELD